MKLHLASTAELYAEHRRTGSTRKRQRIAAELQRRHDEQYGASGVWLFYEGQKRVGRFEKRLVEIWFPVRAFDFGLCLPQSPIANRKSEISR